MTAFSPSISAALFIALRCGRPAISGRTQPRLCLSAVKGASDERRRFAEEEYACFQPHVTPGMCQSGSGYPKSANLSRKRSFLA